MKTPKVLFYDIETSPLKVWTFRIGSKISVPYSSIVEGSKMDIICAAWKWGHESTIHSETWGYKKQNSSTLVKKLSDEIEKADIIIGHNADNFDWKHLNTQRLMHGLSGIDWSKASEDTLKQIRRHFYLPSYKLDYIASMLGIGEKSPMSLSDWIDIVEKKDERKLDKMVKYCKRDVLLLQKVYNKIKPYVRPKREYLSKDVDVKCVLCGSGHVIRFGTYAYKQKVFQKFFCKEHNGYAGKHLIK